MPVAAIPNNGSQVERATRAWLIDATSDNPDGYRLTQSQIFIVNDSRDRPDPSDVSGLIDIFAKQSQDYPEFSGNEEWEVEIRCKFPARTQPGGSNTELNRLIIDRVVGLVDACMRLQSNSGGPRNKYNATVAGITSAGRALKTAGTAQDQANNADMDQFTCLKVRRLGHTRGNPKDDEGTDTTLWLEILHFKIEACPVAIT